LVQNTYMQVWQIPGYLYKCYNGEKLMSLSLLICQQAVTPGNGKKSWYNDHCSSWLSTSLTDEKINRIIALLHSDQWLTVCEVAKGEGINISFCFTILNKNLAMQHHPCWLCKNAYSVCSQLLSTSEICLFHPQLRTCHVVITRNQINIETFTKWTKYHIEKIQGTSMHG
jgi:hypothetical protein